MEIIGICYECRREVEWKDFSKECYRKYQNVTHKGKCSGAFEKRVEEFKSQNKETLRALARQNEALKEMMKAGEGNRNE